jgi:L-fuconolactonase
MGEIRMKIDGHQHFWIYTSGDFGWISTGMEVLKQDYLPEDLAPLLQANGLDGSVVVQAMQTLQETEWLLGLANQTSFLKGVVGWVDLCGVEVSQQLERFASNPKFRGVRHIVQSEPDEQFMLRPDFQNGIRSLGEFGLTYDLLVLPHQLTAACELVAAFPDQPFVLDHLAKPLIKDGLRSPWDQHVRRLASFPNVCCKISGMVTEADWKSWRPADFKPYLDIVFEAFGPERILYGSDWPVCRLAAEYDQVFRLLDEYITSLSASEQAAVLGGVATRFYGLST